MKPQSFVRRGSFVATIIAILLGVMAGSPVCGQTTQISQADLQELIQLGIDDDAILAKIKADGVAFVVDEQTLDNLKKAGASQAILDALKANPMPSSNAAMATPPILYDDVLKLLKLGIGEQAILDRLNKSPSVFTLSPEQIADLKAAGATQTVLDAMQKPRPVSAAAAELITDFAIVLDCSGSMKESTLEGETKMTAAKRVVDDMVQKIPNGLNVTFIIYGHEAYGGADDPRNCQAVKIARPLASLNAAGKAELSNMIAGLKPTGTTPIALSLRVAGEELRKNDAYCGLVLITDGLETCQGDPVAEAARLASNPKLTFGVNVVGFGAKPEEDKVLAEIAKSGNGKYYGADSARELADALGSLSTELDKVATPPISVPVNRRAIKVLKPAIEFPEYEEIQVVSFGIGSSSVEASGKYGEEIRIPTSTTKYEIRWVPKKGLPVAILKDFTLSERKVIEIKLEEHLGMIRVSGQGTPKKGILVYKRGLGSIIGLQECKNFGEIMVVPAETVIVSVDDEDIEQGLIVEAGKLHELE